MAKRRKPRLKLKVIADSGESIVDLSKKKSIVGDKYTIISKDKLKADHKLVSSYQKVRNLEYNGAPIVDMNFPIQTLIFKSIKQRRPAFNSNEHYLKTYSTCKFPQGKMLVILPQSLWASLKSVINRYVIDVAREGYFAEVHTVENAAAPNIKQLINSRPCKGVLLVGNVAPAFYKHENSKFPCDLYYMDKNGGWQQENGEANTFKNHTGDVDPEIWLGRLFTPTDEGNDIHMLQEYFNRNHSYRTGGKAPRRDALAFVDDDWSGYPKKIKKAWKGLPNSFQSNVNAAVRWPTNDKVYLFQGDEYVRYDTGEGEMDTGYPKKISAGWTGFPAQFDAGIDAAVAWPGDKKLYFFKGDSYIRYDVPSQKVDAGYPKKISAGWPTLPASFKSGIDAANLWPNGKIYFFKGNRYLRYDTTANKMDPGYPKLIAGNWNGFSEEFENQVTAAATFPNGNAYYFSDNMYIRYNTTTFEVSKGFDDCGFDKMFSPSRIKVYTHPNETQATNYKNEIKKIRSWVQLCAHSGTQSHSFSADPPGGSVNSTYLRDTRPPKAYFYNLFCCSSGRFTTPNYIAGWYIFDKAGGFQCEGLSAVASAKTGSMLHFEDFYEPMGQGKDIGPAYLNWWKERGATHDDGEIYWFYGLTLLGDPTLTWTKGCTPTPISPDDGEVFSHFPRQIQLRWKPVPLSGVKYDVEIDAKGAINAGQWAAQNCKSWLLRTHISGTSFNHNFVGAQPGRWRVRTRIGNKLSPWCEWQYFRFTR